MKMVGLMQVVAEEFDFLSTHTIQPPIQRFGLTAHSLDPLPLKKRQLSQQAP